MVNKSFRKSMLVAFSFVFFSISISAFAADPIFVDSQQNFAKTVDSIKGAIKDKGVAIIYEANHKNMIEMVGGTAKPSITIGFAKPQLGQKLLSIEPLAGIEMPMRISVRELDDGSVKVIYYKPEVGLRIRD